MNLRRTISPSRSLVLLLVALGCQLEATTVRAADQTAVARFETHCFSCHADGAEEGSFSFDKLAAGEYGDETIKRWEAVWKNLRAETMPPVDEEQPSPKQRKEWAAWIQKDVFRLDPKRIDPGKVVLRRLNRAEYQETIHQLTELNHKVGEEFPADDTGYGFDTIGEVLHLSPVLMEKYLAAAGDIVNRWIPVDGPAPPEKRFWSEFRDGSPDGPQPKKVTFDSDRSLHLKTKTKHSGQFRIEVKWDLQDAWTNTKQHAHAHLVWHKSDGSTEKLDSVEIGFLLSTKGVLKGEISAREEPVHVSVEFQPTSGDTQPTLADYKDPAPYWFKLHYVDVIGPTDKPEVREYRTGRQILVEGPPKPDADEAELERKTVACIRQFGLKAFRRPVDDRTVERLATIAHKVRNTPGNNYEHGIAEVARLMFASPRFLFRVEETLPADKRDSLPEGFATTPLGEPIDEFAFATRLSYFLLGGPPDYHLMPIAEAGQVRERLEEMVDQMVRKEWRLRVGMGNFVGQWLKTRDVHQAPIDVAAVTGVNRGEETIQLDWNLREGMKEETEALFRHLIIENRPVEELLTANYTFLNEPLAKHYGIDGVHGYETQRVDLPETGHRGGLLTHASMHMVTSNPSRTSPVKRGLFLMENILGTPAPPAPPNVPPLEESFNRQPKGSSSASLRSVLEFHRSKPACAGCHNRMDPLGLALENFNALGQFRNHELADDGTQGTPIDPSGQLMTGEKFTSVRDLASILANDRRDDFYRCLTEKMLVYALGRGLTYRDATTVDNIVVELKADGGKVRTLILAIVRSVPFNYVRK